MGCLLTKRVVVWLRALTEVEAKERVDIHIPVVITVIPMQMVEV